MTHGDDYALPFDLLYSMAPSDCAESGQSSPQISILSARGTRFIPIHPVSTRVT